MDSDNDSLRGDGPQPGDTEVHGDGSPGRRRAPESLAPSAITVEPELPPAPRRVDILPWSMALGAVGIMSFGAYAYESRWPQSPLLASEPATLAEGMDEPEAASASIGDAISRTLVIGPFGPSDLEAFAAASDRAQPRVLGCFPENAKMDTLRLNVRIAPEGTVRAVTLQDPASASRAERECIQRAYGQIRLAPFEGPDAEIQKTLPVR